MEFVTLLVVIVMGAMWWVHTAKQEKENEHLRQTLKAAQDGLVEAADARTMAEAQLRTSQRLVERLTVELGNATGPAVDLEKTHRRFSDKFDRGAGKPLPFPQLYDANAI